MPLNFVGVLNMLERNSIFKEKPWHKKSNITKAITQVEIHVQQDHKLTMHGEQRER